MIAHPKLAGLQEALERRQKILEAIQYELKLENDIMEAMEHRCDEIEGVIESAKRDQFDQLDQLEERAIEYDELKSAQEDIVNDFERLEGNMEEIIFTLQVEINHESNQAK